MTLVMSHRRVGARMDASAAGHRGLDALRIVMLEALPLDEVRDLEAQIEISFWGPALGNPALRNLQHSEFDRRSKRLRAHLDEAAELGEIGENDLDLVTHQLVALIDGVSAERVLYPTGCRRSARPTCSISSCAVSSRTGSGGSCPDR